MCHRRATTPRGCQDQMSATRYPVRHPVRPRHHLKHAILLLYVRRGNGHPPLLPKHGISDDRPSNIPPLRCPIGIRGDAIYCHTLSYTYANVRYYIYILSYIVLYVCQCTILYIYIILLLLYVYLRILLSLAI